MSGKSPETRNGRWKRIGLIVVATILAVLGMAWFYGGEEPLRPIVQPVDVPEGMQ